MALSSKPSIRVLQWTRGQTVRLTQKEHWRISLPQMPSKSHGWPESIEAEDLTNSILVNPRKSSTALLKSVSLHHFYFMQLTFEVCSVWSQSTIHTMTVLYCGSARFGLRGSLVHHSVRQSRDCMFCKSRPLCFATVSQGMCSKTSLLKSNTGRNVLTNTLFCGVCHCEWGKKEFLVVLREGKVTPAEDLSRNWVRMTEVNSSAASPKSDSQSHTVLHTDQIHPDVTRNKCLWCGV